MLSRSIVLCYEEEFAEAELLCECSLIAEAPSNGNNEAPTLPSIFVGT